LLIWVLGFLFVFCSDEIDVVVALEIGVGLVFGKLDELVDQVTREVTLADNLMNEIL